MQRELKSGNMEEMPSEPKLIIKVATEIGRIFRVIG